MTFLATVLTLTAVSICVDLGLAQNNPSTTQKNASKPSSTAVEKSSEVKELSRSALILVKADRERIYALLTDQMKEREFSLIKKDANKIVFSKRASGAEAATMRKQFDRRLSTPIVDDPRDILAFVLIEKNNGCVVGARHFVTTIVNSEVISLDVSQLKEARKGLNRILQRLKSDAEIPQVSP